MTAPDSFSHDRYLVEQLIRPIANIYKISANGQPVAFVRQKKLALKEDIRFFADEGETQEVFRLKARSVLDIAGTYDVTGPGDEPIGALAKVFGASLLRSTWRLLGSDAQELAQAQEQSLAVALLRRVWDFPLPYHFDINAPEGRRLGTLSRAFSIRDRYELDLSGDVERRIDRRLAIALAVGLDALQAR